jgi:hypothetical protein
MSSNAKWLFIITLILCGTFSEARAWGGLGHRTVAAIAAQLLSPAKLQAINKLLAQLEMDGNFVDAASYPDEFIRGHDPGHKFNPWHYADFPDDGTPFVCGECLFKALPELAIMRQGGGKAEAVHPGGCFRGRLLLCPFGHHGLREQLSHILPPAALAVSCHENHLLHI